MEKIILFYKYVPIANPQTLMRDLRMVCENNGLKGRIILADEGINGTLGGTAQSIEGFKSFLLSKPLFSDVDFKEGAGQADHFPRLQVIVKKEIVN